MRKLRENVFYQDKGGIPMKKDDKFQKLKNSTHEKKTKNRESLNE